MIVVGGEGGRQAMACAATLAWLRARATDTRRMCSVCSGAFPLAAAGLLDGRRATTHWRRADQLQRRFPAVRVEPDRIHVRDGPIWTSAGITAGIDLALALVAEDLGEVIARRVAREMVVYYRRPGGQKNFRTPEGQAKIRAASKTHSDLARVMANAPSYLLGISEDTRVSYYVGAIERFVPEAFAAFETSGTLRALAKKYDYVRSGVRTSFYNRTIAEQAKRRVEV